MFSQSYNLDHANDTMIGLLFWLVISLLILIFLRSKHLFKLPDNTLFFPKISFPTLLLSFIIYLGTTISIAQIMKLVFFRFFSESAPTSKNEIYIGISSFFMVLIPLVLILLYLYRFKKTVYESLFIQNIHFWKTILVGIAACFLTLPFVIFISSISESILLYLYGLTELPDQLAVDFLKSSVSNPYMTVLATISIIFLSPIIEEILFRGIFQNWIRQYVNRRWTIFLVAIFFTLFHFALAQGIGNVVILCTLFILAWALSFIYERQGSLYAPIALHIMFNGLNVLQLLII